MNMDDSQRNSFVLQIANVIKNDDISLDEQNSDVLEKYEQFASKELGVSDSDVSEIVNEAFLYLKMQQNSDIDPVKEGDRFGVGFS
tara:strand:- start:858 stop:1115 length:258 start_codon:yes stop_codon:yes gene_type:complete